MLTCVLSDAQTTKVRGRIFDASDGNTVPFAAVMFEGTQVGVSCDMDGNFYLTTRDLDLTVLEVHQVGYVTEKLTVKPGAFNEFTVMLHPDDVMLDAVVVKADNSKARRLLANIDRMRQYNNPEEKEDYSCDVYSKIDLGMSHPHEQLRSKTIKKEWGFVFDYVDTSDVSGIPYLPILVNESVTSRYHSLNPKADREVIRANRLSGSDPTGNLLAQFTGSMHLKNNFYSPFLNIFEVEVPSPINSNGLLFYDYFIIDSLQVDGRKTLQVRFHPKKAISTPSFDGEMLVDAEEFALVRMKARIKKGQNINWIRDMALEASYQRLADSTWFYKTDYLYADFSLVSSDSTKMISFIGNRTLEFTNPVFEKSDADLTTTVTTVDVDAAAKNDEYWDEARPYPLSEREKGVYKMVDKVQQTGLYKAFEGIVTMLVNGYYDIGKIGVGPVLNFISFNPTEGFRLLFGLRTTDKLDPKNRYMAYMAYGFKDKMFKGGFEYEHLFSKEPTSKLDIRLHYDMVQVGSVADRFDNSNILSSVLGGGSSLRMSPELSAMAVYQHEFNGGINGTFTGAYRELYSNAGVPMKTPDGRLITSVPEVAASMSMRFSKDETVIRGKYLKRYMHTKHPLYTINLTGGVLTLNEGAGFTGAPMLGKEKVYPYFMPKASIGLSTSIAPIGHLKMNFTVGTIVGKVPYTHLHLHDGNGTWSMNKDAFSTMGFFEFASDSWATLMLEHNFYGFFLGKIPLIKKLQLRELFILRGTWGYLSEKNGTNALVKFPEGLNSMGNIPFIETGFGITNILRFLRVDFIWRVTHRNDNRTSARNFVMNVGLEVNF